MTCEEFNRMLDNYENLTDQEKLLMNEHASVCEKCRDELDFMLAIIMQLNTLPKIETPADFMDKLNERISLEDFEDRKLNRMINVLRRNYKRYSTVAACLILAVVVGVNGKSLINSMLNDDNSGVIIETSSVAETDSPVTDLKPEFEIATVTENAEPEMKTEPSQNKAVSQATEKAVSVGSVQTAKADDSASAIRVPMQNVNLPESRIEPIREISESFDFIEVPTENNRTPAVDGAIVEASVVAENAAAGARAASIDNMPAIASVGTIDANVAAGIAVASEMSETEEPAADGIMKNYTIARGVYRLPDAEIAKSELEASSRSEDGVIQIVDLDNNAELTIARGRYYIPVEDRYVNVVNSNEIEIHGDDADRAVELIQQYTAVSDDSYYVINSEDISPMLEHMDREGINYQNNVENYDGEKISFKVVIE